MTKRVTFQLFIKGLLHQFIADHNSRSLTTFLEVDDKIEKQWDGVSLEQLATEPYTFYHLGQKFVLKWVVADPDSDLPDTFALEANGDALTTLEYMSPSFQLEDKDPAFFDADVFINNDDEPMHKGNFEWRAGTFSHKIAEHIRDETIKSVKIKFIKHPSEVTSEALSALSKFNKPSTGFEKLYLQF